MKTADAWILPLASRLAVAVGAYELRHVLPDVPALFAIPQAPAYCCRVLLWQERIVPLMDLAARFCFVPEPNSQACNAAYAQHIAIVAYWSDDSDAVEHGALLLHGLPWRCSVADAQACELPDAFAAWRAYTQACIQLEEDTSVTPVLSLNRLFARRRE